jgi:plasmid stability protein
MAVLNLRGIPDDLRNQFKATCAAKGKTMTEEFIRLMREEVEKAGRGKS